MKKPAITWEQNIQMSALGRSKGINWLVFLEKAYTAGLISHKTPNAITLKEYELIKSTLESL